MNTHILSALILFGLLFMVVLVALTLPWSVFIIGLAFTYAIIYFTVIAYKDNWEKRR